MSNQKLWRIAGDVIFTPKQSGMIASNHRAKRHVWVNNNLLNALLGHSPIKGLRAADLTTPANIDGLLEDPTGISKDDAAPEENFETFEDALNFLVECMIVIRDEEKYAKYFKKRSSLFDMTHLGTFHQRLGADLRLRYRLDPDDWWLKQKYGTKSAALKNNLYKQVQSTFIEEFTANQELNGKKILDFGCGPGLTAEYFIRGGAKVWGADPNTEMLELAQLRLSANFIPLKLILERDRLLSALPNETFDLIWLSDVLMFYFYPPDAGESFIKPSELLSSLADRLADAGKLVIMQPHGYFWLTPWLGDDENPYTIMTEYAERVYSVSPSLEEMSEAIQSAGLTIDRIYEPLSKDDPVDDLKASSFAHKFPLWWTFECRKAYPGKRAGYS